MWSGGLTHFELAVLVHFLQTPSIISTTASWYTAGGVKT